MKIKFLKKVMFLTLLFSGLLITSCKDNNPEEVDPIPESLEPMEPSYDNETDTIMTETDSITKANREHDEFEMHKQVP